MSDQPFSISITVRFSESDMMAIAHHGVYPTYLEEARSALVNSVGIDLVKFFHQDKLAVAVTHLEIDYKRPLPYAETFEVRCWLTEVNGYTLAFRYEIVNTQGQTCATALTRHVVVNDKGVPTPMLDSYLQQLKTIVQPKQQNAPVTRQ
jgi:acyl-CoA thioester hydrolase